LWTMDPLVWALVERARRRIRMVRKGDLRIEVVVC
jgi:hypothetical protein